MESETFKQIMQICDNRINFEALAEDFKNDRILPFIGAGFSKPQFPLWKDFLEEKAELYGVGSEVEKEIQNGNMEKAASLLMKAMGQRSFKDYFVRTFKKEVTTYTENQQWLPKLFKETVITTNYDHLLEALYKNQRDFTIILPRYDKDQAVIDRMLQQGKAYLVKLHGDVERYEYCILTEEDYNEVYTGDSEYEQFLSNIFENKMMLFLGCSLVSDRTLGLLKRLNNNREIVHYAIVSLPEETNNPSNPNEPIIYNHKQYKPELLKRMGQLSDLNIRPIWYPYDKHEIISYILEKLHQARYP